jgi:hypothetical protein
MKRVSILVKAMWDDEAKVWFAQSGDIDGLATEAPTVEELQKKVLVMIGELLQLNGHPEIDADLPDIPVYFMAEQSVKVANPLHI